MRAFGEKFRAWNSSRYKERRVAIKLEMAVGVALWLVSHDDVTPGSGTVLDARLVSINQSSQTLHPEDGRAEIGTLAFIAADIDQDISDNLRSQLLTNDRGLAGKTVELYIGDANLSFADYELHTTQILDRVRVDASGTRYRFQCRDVQRFLRTSILSPVETTLTSAVSATDTTIPVTDTSEFVGVDHGTSWTDAPSTDGVIYLRIEDEIIRTLAADATSTTFTNCVRGVLGTIAEAHDTDADAGVNPEKGEKVTEAIYLELPVPKLAYALQTGVLLNQSGDTLPDHWHAGMAEGFASSAEYEGIGADIYDPSDDTAGIIFRFIDPGEADAKQFVEQHLMAPLGLYQPVRADGALGMRRIRNVVEGTAAVRTLDESVLLAAPVLEYDGPAVINEVEVAWNVVDGEPTRTAVIGNSGSVTRWGARPRKSVEARGLHGSRHSRDVVVDIVSRVLDRYSGPPITTTVQVHGSQADLEVGDIVRVSTSLARDWTGQTVALDRAFEIQNVSIDWLRNVVTLKLFASSESAGAIAPLSNDEGIPDAWYTSAGTNIASLGGVTDAGSELQMGAGTAITGHASLANTAARYYAAKDLTINAGATRAWTGNLLIVCLGTVTINGTLDGTGGGLAGVSDPTSSPSISFYPTSTEPVDYTFAGGNAGGFGTTQAGGGLIERMRREEEGSGYNGIIQSIAAPLTEGAYDVLPRFNVRYDGSALVGLPDDLRGTGGGPGGFRYWSDTKPAPNVEQLNLGGTGGAGGGGIVIIARGIAFGASGKIITDGADGSVGSYNAGNDFPAHAGGGAGGAPGGVLLLVDGLLNPAPTSLGGKIQANYGATPDPSSAFNRLTESIITEKAFFGTNVPEDRLSKYQSSTSGVDASFAAVRVQFVPPLSDGGEDYNPSSVAPDPATNVDVLDREGGMIVTWTPPVFRNTWDRAIVYAAESLAWADREIIAIVDANFASYEFDAYASIGVWVQMARGTLLSTRAPDLDTTNVIGTSLPVGSKDTEYAKGEFFDGFEGEVVGTSKASLRNWDIFLATNASLDVEVVGGSPFGGQVILAHAGIGLRSKRSVPFDPNAWYKVTGYVQQVNAFTGLIYLGVIARKADGTLVNAAGAPATFTGHYTTQQIDDADLSTGVWAEFAGYIHGSAATGSSGAPVGGSAPLSDPTIMIDTTVRMHALALINNGSTTASEQVRIAGMAIERVEAPFEAVDDPRIEPVRDDLDNSRTVTATAPQVQVWSASDTSAFPAGNPSVVLTARFYRDGVQIATQPVTFQLTSASGVVNRTVGTATGETVSVSTTGNGTAAVSVLVTHTASNQVASLGGSAIDTGSILSGGGGFTK